MKHKNLLIIGVSIIVAFFMSFASDRKEAGSSGCRIAAVSDSYEPMQKSITNALQQFNNVDGRNISFSSSTQPYCAVIGYEKKIAGWNCSVKRLAVGFGNSPAAAEDDAKNNKSKDAGSAAGSWVVKTYACG